LKLDGGLLLLVFVDFMQIARCGCCLKLTSYVVVVVVVDEVVAIVAVNVTFLLTLKL